MIYITGDTHGGHDMKKLLRDNLEQKNIHIGEGDYLLITGDFGFPFTPQDIINYENNTGMYRSWMNWFKEQPYTILFVDGNHDNHDWWAEQEITEMFGGKVQISPHAPNVIHLLRGEVYTIEGKTFFTFGGAASIDKIMRVEGISWWSREEANMNDIINAENNLAKCNFTVDYIVTHTIPMELIKSISLFSYKVYPCATAQFLDSVRESVSYDKWFSGHFHMDACFPDDRVFILYNSVTPLDNFDEICEKVKENEQNC